MRVESERLWASLGRGPEEVARGRHRVLGEGVDQLRDAVVEVLLRGKGRGKKCESAGGHKEDESTAKTRQEGYL